MGKDNLFIASNIRYLRKQRGITQEQLGNLCDVGFTTIGNWEAGIRNPDPVKIKDLANVFNISVDDLLLKDLRYSDDETTTIKPQEFKQEVLELMNKTDLSEQEKKMLEMQLEYICGDKNENN